MTASDRGREEKTFQETSFDTAFEVWTTEVDQRACTQLRVAGQKEKRGEALSIAPLPDWVK
jgi:hypothetical protein